MYLTTKQLAEHFQVHHDTIRKWRSEGMPAYQAVKAVRYDLVEVEAWIRNRHPWRFIEKKERRKPPEQT